MSYFVRNHLDFLDAVRDRWGKIREQALAEDNPSLLATAPLFDFGLEGTIGDAGLIAGDPPASLGPPPAGHYWTQDATGRWVAIRGTGPACSSFYSNDPHTPNPACAPPLACTEDILPFDTVGDPNFPLASGAQATLSVQLRNGVKVKPLYFYFIGLNAAAGLVEIPARLNQARIRGNDQLLGPNLNSLICTSIRERLPINWAEISDTNSGNLDLVFFNDNAVGSLLRVVGMIQGQPVA